ncbi:MAG: nickel pincer cofactor biosynthesis protein LarC [Methanimicrococcus sp.]|nr:nickel pincer cofactor biosynthesis protein LarC [Methanimicrococcus sp.]
MKTLLFDPFSGASGDMILGTLIDLGASKEFICQHIEPLANVSVEVQKIVKKGISSTRVVVTEKKPNNARSYSQICDIISNTDLPNAVKTDALGIFKIIAEAESKVHEKPLDHLHFHEVGQDDAIADIVGASLAFFDLKSKKETDFDAIVCKNINVGGGYVECCHGRLPVPAPATLEILKNSSLSFYSDGERELLTPTGAAILSYFSKKFAPPIPFSAGSVLSIGYGAGQAETNTPNVLRVSLMESEPLDIPKDHIEILETNVDDVTGEVLGYLSETLMAMGALDVAILPIYMKKGRPAHLIKVISKPADSEKLALQIIRETGSLGVRVIPTKHRITVHREIVSADVEFKGRIYAVPLKIARLPNGELIHLSAEYEVCKKISAESGLLLRDVISKAEEIGRRNWQK